LQRFINSKRSKGSYFTDTDGNVVLDLDCPLALGYNHDSHINARDSDLYDRFLSGKVSASDVAPSDFADILRENVMPIAPSGTAQVHIADGTVTNANESAICLAMQHYAETHNRSGNLKVLGFENASHGNSIATLSVSDDAVNVGNIPTYDWPKAPLPEIRYPYITHEKANKAEEQRCIDAVR